MAVAHAYPDRQPLLDRLRAYPPHAATGGSIFRVLHTGEPELVSEATPESIAPEARGGGEHLTLLRELAPVSAMIVPLAVRGRTIGAISLVASESGRRYGNPAFELALDLARRAALAVDNAHLYHRAQQATRARDDVLGIVSHDLRNPLATVFTSASFLLELAPTGQSEVERKQLGIIRRSSERATRLIEELLDVTRIEAGRFSIEARLREPAALVAEALESLGPLAAECRIELRSDVSGDLPPIPADSDRIMQVFANLAGNALKFTPEGGLVTLGAEPVESAVGFFVRDTGQGISTEHLPHLFERFWQVDRNDRRGAGLGLAIARGIVEGCRTPFARSGTVFRDLSAVELGKVSVRELISRTNLDVDEIDHVVYGTVVQSVQEPNIAREVTLGSGIPPSVPSFTVARACASSNQAITSAAEQIAIGHADVIVAGGAESLTDIPVLFSPEMRNALVRASKAKSLGERVRAFAGIRPTHLAPITPAIAEPTTGETMGESAEKMAKENGISREEQDRWALRSHRLAAAATADGRLTREIVPTYVGRNYETVVTEDNGIRADTSAEKLAALKPVFDRRYGTVTAGNASPLTDGASAVLLMSEEKAKALGYEPLGYIRGYAYASLAPSDQLLQGPVYAAPLALERAGVTMKDIDLLEIHEAFAAQVLSNLQWFDSDRIARERLGRDRAIGIPPEDQINAMGGSIAIGHPFGATGGRVTITLLNELRRRDKELGMISVCAAGAMGFVMVVERS